MVRFHVSVGSVLFPQTKGYSESVANCMNHKPDEAGGPPKGMESDSL